MRFDTEQRYPGTPDEVLAAYTDPALYRRMDGMARVDRPRVLDVTRGDDEVVVRVRYRFAADLPPGAQAVLDPDRLTWVDETTYDLATRTSRTRLLPDHYPDRLTAAATARVEADPDRPGGSRRLVTGEVTVRARLVGGRVERAIVDGLREHLADEARVVADHLAAARR